MKAGDQVKFAKVMEDGDDAAVMTVIEDRDSRVLVKDNRHADWAIVPTSAYLKSDLVLMGNAK